MTEVALVKDAPAPAVMQDTVVNWVSVFERAARDPAVDVSKMERITDIMIKMQDIEARRTYDAAFAAMQTEMPEIDKRGKIIIRAKDNSEKVIQSTTYALWDDINRLIKPILAKHGFGLSFRINQTPDRLTTTAVLSHVGGHREETSFSAPIDNTGSKNNVQGWGSSFSYGKRYTGTAILNITTRGEDDNGKAAGETPAEAPKLETMQQLIRDTNSSVAWFCEHYSVETLEDLTSKQIADAIAGLSAKRRKMQAKP